MEYISATDAKKTLGAIIAKAQREPIIIQKQNKDAAVIISPKDYARLRQLNIDEFHLFRANISTEATKRGLTEEKLSELLASKD